MLAGILGTMEAKLMRGHASLDEMLRYRMCGRNLESTSHVPWECQDESAAGPCKLLVEKPMLSYAHLDVVLRALMTSLWSLGPSDSVESTDLMSLKTNLTENADLAETVPEIDAALVKH